MTLHQLNKWKDTFPSVGFCLHECRYVLPYRSFQLPKVPFINCDFTTNVMFRKSFPMSMNARLCPTFSSIRFRISDLMLRLLIYLGLNFMQDDWYEPLSILLQMARQFDEHRLLKMLSFLQYIVLGQKTYVHKCVESNSMSMIDMSAFMPAPFWFLLL